MEVVEVEVVEVAGQAQVCGGDIDLLSLAMPRAHLWVTSSCQAHHSYPFELLFDSTAVDALCCTAGAPAQRVLPAMFGAIARTPAAPKTAAAPAPSRAAVASPVVIDEEDDDGHSTEEEPGELCTLHGEPCVCARVLALLCHLDRVVLRLRYDGWCMCSSTTDQLAGRDSDALRFG